MPLLHFKVVMGSSFSVFRESFQEEIIDFYTIKCEFLPKELSFTKQHMGLGDIIT